MLKWHVEHTLLVGMFGGQLCTLLHTAYRMPRTRHAVYSTCAPAVRLPLPAHHTVYSIFSTKRVKNMVRVSEGVHASYSTFRYKKVKIQCAYQRGYSRVS